MNILTSTLYRSNEESILNKIFYCERNSTFCRLYTTLSSQKKDIKLAKAYWQELKERSDE